MPNYIKIKNAVIFFVIETKAVAKVALFQLLSFKKLNVITLVKIFGRMGSRRTFIKKSIVATAGTLIANKGIAELPLTCPLLGEAKVVSTWDFGLAANQVALEILNNGGKAIDAVEAGVRLPEADDAITSVGRGGFPDAEGDVTLDASIMDEHGNCGAVACLKRTLHPISVARAVMERTPHVLLVGEKARKFADSLGFPKDNLLSKNAKKAYKEWKANNPKWREFSTDISNHDTIGMLAIDKQGNLSGACTTSGWAFKIPGRVGDSPIIGAGLYVDNEVGAATSTGTGEEVIKICGSFLIVELMRMGKSPQAACEEAVRRVRRRNPNKPDLFVGFLAMNKMGEVGAFSTKNGFEYAVGDSKGNVLVKSPF